MTLRSITGELVGKEVNQLCERTMFAWTALKSTAAFDTMLA